MRTDPPVTGFIVLSVFGILLLAIVFAAALSIYGQPLQ